MSANALPRRAETLLWVAQRASAAMLAAFVLVHLATIIYAVRGGLTAPTILGRTHGNLAWLLFYGLFVAAVAVHVPIGLRVIAREWLGWRGRSLDIVALVSALYVVVAGWRAIWGLYA